MASEPSASLAGAKVPSNKGATKPASDHPQRLHLHRLEKPTPTLEAWLDAGVFGAHDDEGEECVSGHRKLPTGYEGCTKDSVLVEATKPGVWIWPVRFDIGALTVDGTKPWTLYHYTHVQSFETFARELSSAGDAVNEEVLAKLVLDRLQADFREREPTPSPQNPKGDLELCSIEPGMFRSRKEIRKTMFGGVNRQGQSDKGHQFDEFGDFCIPVRVPGSACRVQGGTHDKENGTHRKEKLMVMVSKEMLDALNLKAQANAAVMKVKRERAARATVMKQQDKSWGCLGFIFGGGGKPSYDDWEEDFASKKQELVAGQDVVNRPKREVGHRQKQMRRTWMKEHFANIKMQEEKEEKPKQAAQRKSGAAPRMSMKAEAALQEQPSGDDAANRTTSRMTLISQRASQFLADPKPARSNEDTRASHVSKMYREFQEKTEGNKEIVRGALTRMKSRRSERMTVQD